MERYDGFYEVHQIRTVNRENNQRETETHDIVESIHVFFAIVFSVPLRFTDSDYPFGIFKLFMEAF
jgi:hypothetical protein